MSRLLNWTSISERTGPVELIRIINRRFKEFKGDSDTTLLIHIDGGGSAITTGVKLDIPFNQFGARIVRWDLVANASGSIVIDLWKDTYGNYPPTVADTITASAKPTLSSVIKNQNASLDTWTTKVEKGETLRVNVDSATTVTRITLALGLVKL